MCYNDNGNSPLQNLINALGDLSKYKSTMWFYDMKLMMWNTSISEKFKLEITSPPHLDNINYEGNRLGMCFCRTDIRYHYLIQHIETKEFYFVGSSCIHRFNGQGGTGLKRTCSECHKPNKCFSLRCKVCRVKCKLHKEYHDDNSQCEVCDQCNKIHATKDFCTTIKFGKYYGQYIECIYFKDYDYVRWLRNQESIVERYPELKPFLDEKFKDVDCSYLMKWGKHCDKTIKWIYENDYDYFIWLSKYDYVINKRKQLKQEINQLSA